MGNLDGSPDPAHIDPGTGAVTDGPWQLITTLVGANPVVDNYDGGLGGPAHECGSAGCIPWVERLDAILTPLCISLLVVAFALQVAWFMAGQQLRLRTGLLPCLLAAAVLGAGLPLHLAGRLIDAGSWMSQALVQRAFQGLGDRRSGPLDMMTVLDLTAYCPEDSPIEHPSIHISLPGLSPAQQVLVKPWMDPHFTQSHCLAADSPDFTKEVLDRSQNFFGPPLHDANCDRGDADPTQPLCTNTDNQVNDNAGQECLEGSGGSGLGGQLGALPLPGEPRAGNGQSPSDCRYADIYWGTVPSFTDVWAGIGPHGRNGFDVPDGLQGMVAYSVLTLLALWLALTYVARYLVLALLAGCSSVSFLVLSFPAGRELFIRYWRVVAMLSGVVVVQTLVFLVFVAVVSTKGGLAPASGAAGCPLALSPSCRTGVSGLLGQVGSGDPGNQFAKCLFAIVTVWLMLELPKRISAGELSTARGLRTLVQTSGAIVLGGAAVASTEVLPRATRFGGRRVLSASGSLLGWPSREDHGRAEALEQAEVTGTAAWPQAPGFETREQFVGRNILARAQPAELERLLGAFPVTSPSPGAPAPDAEMFQRLGRDYLRAGGSLSHRLDAEYLNRLRRGRLRPEPAPRRDPYQ